jgi:hypothetical protein
MLGRNDHGELVLEDFDGLELVVARDEGDGAEVETVVEDFVGNIAGKQAMDANLDAGMGFAELGEGGKQAVDGTFVDAESEFAAIKANEVGETLFDFVAEVDEALGVFAEHGAGVGEANGTGAADEERLAEIVFKLADGKADGGLGAEETFGSAREAAFAGNGKKDLEFAEIHGGAWRAL